MNTFITIIFLLTLGGGRLSTFVQHENDIDMDYCGGCTIQATQSLYTACVQNKCDYKRPAERNAEADERNE